MIRPFLLALVPLAAAAAPVTLSHTGYVLDAADAPVNGPLALRIGVWTAAANGTRVWWSGSTACTPTAASGYYAVSLGGDCGATLTTTELPPDADRWLEIELGGITLGPRSRVAVGASAAEALVARAVVAGGVTSAMLAPTGVAAGNYTNANLSIGSDGRVTAASNGAPGGITSLTAGAGLSGGTITSTGTIALTSDASSLFKVTGGAASSNGTSIDVGGTNYEALLNVEGSIRANAFYLSGGTLNLNPACISYGACTGNAARLQWNSGATLIYKSNTPDAIGAGYAAHQFDTTAAVTNAQNKLLSVSNNGSERLSLDKDGNAAIAGQIKLATSTSTACGSTEAGSIRYRAGALEWCNGGGAWQAVGAGGSTSSPTLVLNGANRQWSDGTVAASCESYRRPTSPYTYTGSTGSGTYNIQPASATVPFVAYCDMDNANGGWTYVLMTNTSGVFNTSTTYSSSGGYYVTTPPAHAQIALMVKYQGNLEAGIANVKLRNYAQNDSAALFSFTNPTWELWSSTWASYTTKTITSCFHSSWQDECVAWSGGTVGTCNGVSTHAYPPSATSWVNHGGCMSGNAANTNVIIAVR